MTSQLDLDQGGTARSWNKLWMGPSVGWIWIPNVSVLPIIAPGTYILDPSTNYVTVNTPGAVIVILPSVATPTGGAQAQPNLFAQAPVTIVDVGGFAFLNPITILPNPGPGQTIMGASQIQITVNFGAFTLAPNSTLLTWNTVSP